MGRTFGDGFRPMLRHKVFEFLIGGMACQTPCPY